jgi:hypothetical protein
MTTFESLSTRRTAIGKFLDGRTQPARHRRRVVRLRLVVADRALQLAAACAELFVARIEFFHRCPQLFVERFDLSLVTGHAFNPQTMLARQGENVETATWSALRALARSRSSARGRTLERQAEEVAKQTSPTELMLQQDEGIIAASR